MCSKRPELLKLPSLELRT